MTKSINILTKFGINPIKTTKVREPKHLWRERERKENLFFKYNVQWQVAQKTYIHLAVTLNTSKNSYN